jgi:Raf kinase inhibitor-like YbhB/YbcL family protein
MAIDLTSPAFEAGARIPMRYTRDGQNVSPPLQWSRLPEGTRELALVADDPDAPSAKPFVHWVAYKVDAASASVDEGVSHDATPARGAVHAQGRNSYGTLGYDGPAPPSGHGPHRYRFHLYALDAPLATSGKLEKENLIAAMAGHVLDEGELVGIYERPG